MRHVQLQSLMKKIDADFSRANCPQQQESSKWQKFRIWDEPAIIHVPVREWQDHQQCLQDLRARPHDLVRLIELHPGPLAVVAAIHFLITCICRPSRTVPGSASEQAARYIFEHMESTMSHEQQSTDSESSRLPTHATSDFAGPCIEQKWAWEGLQQLEAQLNKWPGSTTAVSLRTWRLGELQPLAGWRTRDRMSSVSALQPCTF